jgi:hypothetical protein
MSESYRVENNRPVRVFPGRPPKYPFRRMKVGQSFKFSMSNHLRVVMATAKWKERHPEQNFRVSKEELRCHRIA